jgi:predicted DsbA family dithiol-disulfide isomerase
MSVIIDVWSDFVCPYCYAVAFSLKELRESHSVEIHWRSYELRPAGSPPIPPGYLAQIEAARPRFKEMMWAQYGVDIQQGPFGISTYAALTGEKVARAAGLGDAYHEAVTSAYWLEARSIDQREELRDIAVGLGMDGAAFLAGLDDPAFQADVDADIRQAYEYGLSGVPALIFAGKYLVSGARPYELLAQVVDKVEQEQAQA